MPIRTILNFVKGMSHLHTHFQCPVCGRSVGVKGYDPEGRPLDVLGKNFRGLGRGRGFEVSDEESILHTNPDDPVLLKIKDRVADVYDLFFEDDSVEELLDRINEALGTSYDTLMAASEDAFSRLEGFLEEDELDEVAPVAPASTQPVTQEFDVEEDLDEEESMVPVDLHEEESSAVIDHEISEVVEDEDDEEALSELDYEILRGEREDEEEYE